MDKLKTIDLFAGAGGLSQGFEQTGMFHTKVAVEINRYARETFQLNHPEAVVLNDIRQLDYDQITEQTGPIDVVIGGPPCQGFSNANRQRNELISGNNSLVKEFVRAVEHLKPRAFVMENVKSMKSHTHKFFYSILDYEELNLLGTKIIEDTFVIGKVSGLGDELVTFIESCFDVEPFLLNKDVLSKLSIVIKHGYRQNALNEYILREQRFFEKVLHQWADLHGDYWCDNYRRLWDSAHALLSQCSSNEDGSGAFLDELRNAFNQIVEIQRVLRKIDEVRRHRVELYSVLLQQDQISIKVKTFNVFEYVESKLKACGYEIASGVLNSADIGVPQLRERLFIIGVRREYLKRAEVKLPVATVDQENYFTVGDAISDLEAINPEVKIYSPPVSKTYIKELNWLQKRLLNSDLIYNHVVTDSRDDAKKRFEALAPGENFHNLDESLKKTYTDASRTQNTIYQRLNYEKPSGTVCNVRKSMWIHPTLNRAVSIREAARLQSFPDSFVFRGTKDAQYQQVGNAVPPLLGEAIAHQVAYLLGLEVANFDAQVETELVKQ